MIGIITAISSELEAVKKYLESSEIYEKAGMTFYKGKINNKDVVLVKSGVGKVNAASCTQILIDKYNVDKVINMGVGGALANSLMIGDIVISKDTMQYDMDASAFGHKKGEIPNLDVIYFQADQSLINSAVTAAIDSEIRYQAGRIMTADLGLSDSKLKRELVNEYNGLICDMEGAAIAQVAYINNVPFLIIRSVSDNADEEAMDLYSQNAKNSSEAGAELVLKMLEKA